MRKLMFILWAAILYYFMIDTVYAGKLNEHEQAIIEAAGAVYEHNGISYKVEQRYIDQLTNYFLQDGIDVTAGDKELLIQSAFDNIELGIRNGYMKPIDDLEFQGDNINGTTELHQEDTFEEILESVGKDISFIENNIPSLIDYNGNSYTASEAEQNDTTNIISQSPDKDNTKEETDISKGVDNSDTREVTYSSIDGSVSIDAGYSSIDGSVSIDAGYSSIDGSVSVDAGNSSIDGSVSIDAGNSSIDESVSIDAGYSNIDGSVSINAGNSSIELSVNNNDSNSMEDEIIKPTGFSLNGTLYIMTGLGLLMIMGLFIAFKNNYFACAYE